MLNEKLDVRTISLSKIECLLSQMKASKGWWYVYSIIQQPLEQTTHTLSLSLTIALNDSSEQRQ